MKRRLSLLLQFVFAFGTGPALAAEVPPSGAERWRLRPSDPTITSSTAAAPAKVVPSEMREPRSVRIVYPALVADR